MRPAVALLLVLAGPLSAQSLPEPIQTRTDHRFESCRGAGGTPELTPGYLTEADLDGDGLLDLIVDQRGLTCAPHEGLFCNSAGCEITVWMATRPGNYMEVFGTTALGFAVEGGRVVFDLHPALFCPDAPAEAPCRVAWP